MDVEWEEDQMNSEENIEMDKIENIRTQEQKDENGNRKNKLKWRIQEGGNPKTERGVYSDTTGQIGQLNRKEEEDDAILQRYGETDQVQILEDKNQSNRKRKKDNKEVNKSDKKRLRDKQEKENLAEESEEKTEEGENTIRRQNSKGLKWLDSTRPKCHTNRPRTPMK